MNGMSTVAMVMGIIGLLIFSLFLMMTGQGDSAGAYQTWIIASSIILSGGIIASGLNK